jgi:very-short-patch-repair endonuclease
VETDLPIAEDVISRIQKTRRELLDLSARNRLISTPRGTTKAKRLDIVDERSEEVFRLLVRERRAMSFLPGSGEPEEGEGDSSAHHLEQPEEIASDGGTPDPRHTDLRLQTRLKSEKLQARLLELYYDARTYEEEQGVSILYLAMGFLKWYEAPSSDKARYAPLLLIPVDLERQSAASRFQLRYREEDVTTNLSLQAKLKTEFGAALPDVPDMDEASPTAYFEAVAQALSDQPRWGVLRNDMIVGFFSFAKFLMYRDLDPASWPAHSPLGNNPILSKLVGDAKLVGHGFADVPPLCGEDDKIDRLIPPGNQVHITDADSSQAVLIEEVRRGRHLVVQGPPGTGKSQTITNLIASAVKQGKRVLFVAEKMAALEVVYSRLKQLGLDAICLELHSSKANKKAVLEQMARTLELGRPKAQGSAEGMEVLQASIDRLNRHAEVMNSPLEPADVTPFQAIGCLSHLRLNGVGHATVSFSKAETWSRAEFLTRRKSIEELQNILQEVGPVAGHPWRGVKRTEHILPGDRGALLSEVADTVASLNAVLGAYAQISEILGLPQEDAPCMRAVERLAQFALRIVKAPPMDRQAIASAAWISRRDEISALVQQAQERAETRLKLQGMLGDVAWQFDLSATRLALAGHGRSLLRWLRRGYRDAVAMLRSILKVEMPRTLAERLAILDAAIGVQLYFKSLEDDPSIIGLGRDAFGACWKGSKSDWSAFADIVKWEAETHDARLAWDFRTILSRLEHPDACRPSLRTVSEHLKPASNRLREIVNTLSLDCVESFGGGSVHAVPIRDLIARLGSWVTQPEALSKWITYQIRRRRLEQIGLSTIVSMLYEGRIEAGAAVNLFQTAYYEALIRHVFLRYQDLAEFDGQSHEQWIGEFRNLDQARIEMARRDVAAAHYDAIPRNSAGGDMAVLRGEIQKKRNHRPIRRLMKDAGTAILAIKPVFMMSPISIAQYLEPGSVTFDLLLIDEASQVSPVDALGAMARAKQVVVVGDDKQLPPTRFFSKMLEGEDTTEDSNDNGNTADLGSVLGLCIARGMPTRMLRWHYRSRHHSLIAVSNREFYENRLYVVPSPTTITAVHGLHFRFIKDGVYDRGGTRTNRVEAKAIAEAVIDHARRYPNKSLGVGAFSIAQQGAIRDELEVLQRAHVELSDFFAPGRPEPFFVKNLENIQGDERDVIFISVGYAKDASGYMAMSFGPLSSEGGERRLNVLISRARERCEVFSSIKADDIDLERAKTRGAAAFKTFLRYAETGDLDTPSQTGRDFDSDFEKQVAVALEAQGYEVHCQVGTAGFFIDLAIVDSVRPGRYLLGIECDGATYHSSRSARDRDRLREAVLTARGWQIHRVWSTDWFHRPREQLQKIVDAIKKARLDAESDEEAETDLADANIEDHTTATEIERTEQIEESNGQASSSWVTAYVEAAFDAPSMTPIHETNPSVLASIVARVVEIEGPIHRDEIARRVTCLWGLQRTGNRIAEVISRAIDQGIRSRVLRCDADFATHCDQAAVPVRCRSNVTSQNLRKPEMIPPAEVREAIKCLVSEQLGMRRDEVALMVARALGFRAMSARMKDIIEKVLARMLDEKIVTVRDQKLFVK